MRLRQEGYNCSQSVLIPFSDELHYDAESLAIITSALGSGVGQGELCGVANALAIGEGIINSDSNPEGKKKAMAGARKLCETFKEPHGGCIRCVDLKGKCGKTCHELVAQGVSIFYDRLNNPEADD